MLSSLFCYIIYCWFVRVFTQYLYFFFLLKHLDTHNDINSYAKEEEINTQCNGRVLQNASERDI